MALVRSFMSYRRNIGQDERDPHIYSQEMWGKFDSEQEYVERVSQEERYRDNTRRKALELTNGR